MGWWGDDETFRLSREWDVYVRYRNLVWFCLLAAIWGSAFMAIKAGVGRPAAPAYFFDAPVLFAALRYDIAGLLMLGYAVWTRDRWRPRTRNEWRHVAIAAIFLIAAYHALLFVGQRGATSAAAAVIVSLSPILTTAFARALLPTNRLTPLGLLGMLIGLLGVVILARPTPANIIGSRFEALVFGAAVCFALGSVLAQRHTSGLPIETMEAWAMLGGALLMHIISVSLGEAVAGPPPLDAVVALGYLAVVASAAGFLLYFDLLERLGPIEINLVSYVVPVFAAITGFLVLGEVIDFPTIGGFLVILIGFVLIKRTAIRTAITHSIH